MDKLQMCRICLAENVCMYVVVNKTLHELYEKLTGNPFVTEDSRPILACFICCAQLKKCYRFMKKCLEAEQMFDKMMNEEYEIKPLINQDQFELFHGFIRTPIDTISIVDVDQTESIVVKEELPAVCERLNDVIETKEGHESDDDLKSINIYDNYLDIEYIPPRDFEAEAGDDVPLMKVKTEMKEGSNVSETNVIAENKKRTSIAEKLILDPRRTKQEDVITAELKNEPSSHLKVIRITQYRASERDTLLKEPSKCNKRLKRVKKLDQSSTKNYEKLYKCDVCQRSFSRTNALKNHLRVHTGEKPYKCDICQRTFGAKNGLTRHFRVHTGEKPYNCNLCRRNFSDKGILSRHMRLHAGEKPFKCDVCQHSFSQMYHLKRHSIIHDGEKRYQCNLCQRFYSTKRILIRHIAVHNGEKPFKCDECQRCFSLKGVLRNHIRIHTGEKPYKCDFCWRRFRNKSFLVRHVQKHTGGKPYKCDICQHCFSHKGNLRNHIITHAEELMAK